MLVVGEGEAAGVAVVPGFQKAVDGGGLRPAGLCQALGRPPGGGGEGRAQPQVVKEGQDPPEGGGLAGARPPGEEHHLLPGGGFHRLHLEGGVGEALVPLDLHQQVLQVVWGAELPPVHGQQGVGHIGLTVVELVQVAGVLPGDGVPDDPPLVQQVLEAGLHGVGLPPQQPLGRGQELGVGEKDVAVVQVVGQGVQDPRLQPEGVLRENPRSMASLSAAGKETNRGSSIRR